MKNIIREIGRKSLPYFVGGAILLSGCGQNEKETYLKEASLRLYDVLLVDPALADRDGNGALDIDEQAEFMRATGYDGLMTGNNFPEIFENREEFKRFIKHYSMGRITMDEVYERLANASAHYSRGLGR